MACGGHFLKLHNQKELLSAFILYFSDLISQVSLKSFRLELKWMIVPFSSSCGIIDNSAALDVAFQLNINSCLNMMSP